MRVCISRIWCAPLLCFGGVQGFVVAAGHGALCVTERQYTTRTAASRCTTEGVLERAAPQRGSRGRASRGRRSEAVSSASLVMLRSLAKGPRLQKENTTEHHDDQSSRKRYGPKLHETCNPRNMQPNTPETRFADPPIPCVWPAAC